MAKNGSISVGSPAISNSIGNSTAVLPFSGNSGNSSTTFASNSIVITDSPNSPNSSISILDTKLNLVGDVVISGSVEYKYNFGFVLKMYSKIKKSSRNKVLMYFMLKHGDGIDLDWIIENYNDFYKKNKKNLDTFIL